MGRRLQCCIEIAVLGASLLSAILEGGHLLPLRLFGLLPCCDLGLLPCSLIGFEINEGFLKSLQRFKVFHLRLYLWFSRLRRGNWLGLCGRRSGRTRQSCLELLILAAQFLDGLLKAALFLGGFALCTVLLCWFRRFRLASGFRLGRIGFLFFRCLGSCLGLSLVAGWSHSAGSAPSSIVSKGKGLGSGGNSLLRCSVGIWFDHWGKAHRAARPQGDWGNSFRLRGSLEPAAVLALGEASSPAAWLACDSSPRHAPGLRTERAAGIRDQPFASRRSR